MALRDPERNRERQRAGCGCCQTENRHNSRSLAAGGGGIRTPDTVARMPHFECGAFKPDLRNSEPQPSRGTTALINGGRCVGASATPRLHSLLRREGAGPTASARCPAAVVGTLISGRRVLRELETLVARHGTRDLGQRHHPSEARGIGQEGLKAKLRRPTSEASRFRVTRET